MQVRTPYIKQKILKEDDLPTDEGHAHTANKKARLGHHNDCFLASDTDYGTYRNKTAEYAYLQLDNQYVPMGGETCNLNSPR